MMKSRTWFVLLLGVMAFVVVTVPEFSFAQVYGGGFVSKVNSLTSQIINFLLPAASILGLVYAAILAATGDGEAKGRMVLVAIASIVGFLAPLLIRWLQSIAGGGG